tara:strand:- start:1024 stop:1362 length:339 start_codon:yes stop_codon:yes gene_type:complete
MKKKQKTIFIIRFFEKDQKDTLEAYVRVVEPSDFPGLVCFRDFVFKDQTKQIILPEEEKSNKRFNRTKAIHIPYHNILFIEEVDEEKPELKQLPFLRNLSAEPSTAGKDELN